MTITLNRLNSLHLHPHHLFLFPLHQKRCQLALHLPLLLNLNLTMKESTKKSLLSIGPFFNLSLIEHKSYLHPPELSMSPFIVNLHLPSLNAFSVIILATIKRIAHSMSVPIVINRLLDTPFPLALLPNVTFVVNGDIPLDSALFKCA